MILRTGTLSALSKGALFGAGVFFHGAADHAITATVVHVDPTQQSGELTTACSLIATMGFLPIRIRDR